MTRRRFVSWSVLLTLLCLVTTAQAQPVSSNRLVLQGAASGSAPTLLATGLDTNISINITPKGAGTVNITSPITVTGAPFAFSYYNALGVLDTTAAATNGQLLIGSTGAIPVAAALTGTANQVVVTNAAGAITLSLPQSIATTSSPTFVSTTLTSLTASLPVFTTAGKLLTTTGTVGVPSGGTGITSYTIGDLVYASAATTLSALADVAVGRYLRSGGVATAPAWSTLVLPNAAVQGDLLVATGANTIGSVVDVAVNQVLTSGGAGAVPVYTGSPTLTAVTAGTMTATSTASFTGGTASSATGQLLLKNATNAFTLGLQPGVTASTFTITLPINPLVAGDLMLATAANVLGVVADVAVNQVLASGGVGVAPAYTGSPTLTAVTAGTMAATATASFTAGTASSATGQLLLKNATNAFTLGLQPGITASDFTITLPISPLVAGDLVLATAANVLGVVADVAVNQVLASGGVGVVPAYTGSPTLTAVTAGTMSATATASYTAGTASSATGQLLLKNATNAFTLGLQPGITASDFTITLPITPLVAGDLVLATGANVLGVVADVAVNQVLASGGVGVVPAYTASPTLTAVTAGTMAATATASFTAGTASSATGQLLLKNATNAFVLGLQPGVTASTFTITLPINPLVAGDVLIASAANTLGVVADVAAGSYLRSGGVGVAPVWSTLLLPNALVQGDLVVGTAANQAGAVADVAVNQVLTSGGVGVVPAWSGSPQLAALGVGAAAGGSGTITFASFLFANIAATLTANGMIGYCSDCVIANPCAGAGAGAIAKRLNGVQVCN